MFTKIVIISVMLIILIALGSGLIFLIQDEGKSNRLVKALTFRIGLSVVLFLFLLSGFYFGWLTPH
jgi:hypothetical protein